MKGGKVAWGGGIILFAMAGPALAQDAGLARCAAIADISQRLACFDGLARDRGVAPPEGTVAAPPPAAAPAPAAPPAAVASPAPAPAPQPVDRRAEFGFSAARVEERRAPQEQQLDRVTATVASIRPFGAGYWTIAMSDGSTWRITESRSSFRPPRSGDTVVLRRASLGSFLLDFDQQAGIRVKRLD